MTIQIELENVQADLLIKNLLNQLIERPNQIAISINTKRKLCIVKELKNINNYDATVLFLIESFKEVNKKWKTQTKLEQLK